MNTAALIRVNLARSNRRNLERLQKMIFSLQACRACFIDGFNPNQFSPGPSSPGLASLGLAPQ
jgi:uncharacterized protein YwgA